MKKIIFILLAATAAIEAFAGCSGGNGFDGVGGISQSQISETGNRLWITGVDSSWGVTQIITDPSYNPSDRVLLACLDAARKAQIVPTLKLTVTGNFVLNPNLWGGQCGMVITSNLNCSLQKR